MQSNVIQDKSFNFSLEAIILYKKLIHRNEYILSKQFFKSATSIGANVEEALAGYSKRDFAAKVGIASKEARETHYWLRLIEAGNFIEFDFQPLILQVEELIRIITSIVKTTQSTLK